MVKIIGFTNRVNGYHTSKGKMNEPVFINACKALSEYTGAPFETYHTKRQASKFFKGHGIVWDFAISKKGGHNGTNSI